MKLRRLLLCVAVSTVLLTGCVPGPNAREDTPNPKGEVAGFWLGLWHGVVAPVTFVVSLFSPRVEMYEVHNNGGWYNFGFLLGIGALSGGGAGGARARRNR